MADPFGTGAGIVGVIGLTIQITQVVVQFGLDWKDAPDNVKTFMAELGTLKTILSETNTNILLNPDFVAAFENRPSLLLSQLGPDAPTTTDTKLMLETCQRELTSLLEELKERGQGHRLDWERFNGAFLAKDTRDSVENLCRQCQTLNNIQERRAILDWLTPIDYATQQSDFIGRRQAGNGQWLLDSAEFQSWLKTDKQTLFCPGSPGAGKTILTSIVVEELTTRFRNNKSIGIAYVYCNFRRQDEQQIDDLLASLLKQLAACQPSLPGSVRDLYNRYKTKRTQLSLDDISRCLQSVVTTYSRVFTIIDALDECQVSHNCRTTFLSEIFSLQAKCGANIFATSRPILEISENFGESTQLEIRASKEDIQVYLDHRISPRQAFLRNNLELQEEIKAKIVNAIEGIFLLAQLHLDSLMGKTTEKNVRSALESLATGSNLYNQAYEDAIERITEQDADRERLAKQVLLWITCAKRPLTTAELQHAITVKPGKSQFNKQSQPDIEYIISVCAGLVAIDKESNIIRLVHYTTQEFFEQKQKHLFPDAQTDIAKACITYLAFDTFEAGSSPTDEAFEARLQENALYGYAARNWGYHAYQASTEAKELILSLLNSEVKLSACTQAMLALKRYSSHLNYSQEFPRHMIGVHVAAYFGLKEVIIALLQNGHEPEVQDTYSRTPLSWAAGYGHEAVVRLLLRQGAALESKDSNGQTPLSLAARHGHEAVVQVLLNTGAELESKDSNGQTPLSWAARHGHEAVVQVLLNTGAELESKDSNGQTPLSWAAFHGQEAVVRPLLETGAELESKDKSGRTPLSWAAQYGQEAVVQLLLAENAVDPDSKDNKGQSPLSWAISNQHRVIIQLLLSTGLISNTDGPAYLRCAISAKHTGIVEFFLAQYLDWVARDNFEWLLDLKTAGVTVAELGSLLFKAANKSPWVSFETLDMTASQCKVRVDFHQTSCAHKQNSTEGESLLFRPVGFQIERESMHRYITGSCGLAGVFPPSENQINNCGSVSFAGTKAMVLFSDDCGESEIRDTFDAESSIMDTTSFKDSTYYSQFLEPSTTSIAQSSGIFQSRPRGLIKDQAATGANLLNKSQAKLVDQLQRALRGLNCASSELQKRGFCCDRYTILTMPEGSLKSPYKVPVVRMNTISFRDLHGFEDGISALAQDGINEPSLSKSVLTGIGILEMLFDIPKLYLLPTTSEQKLHLCALTVQVLSLGLALYSQGHTGEFQPVFLGRPLTEVVLAGSLLNQVCITADLQELACMGSMIADRVFVFRTSHPNNIRRDDVAKCYLSATCEDIVDTWGPGYFITDVDAPFGERLYGLRIGGGIIMPRPLLDTGERQFHWSPDVFTFKPGVETFTYRTRILVGAITINELCPLKEETRRELSKAYLTDPGPRPTTWGLDEIPIVGQVGQYASISVGAVYHKQPGKTLKSQLLDRFACFRDLRLFNSLWGLQISLCTGVTRRVPLRALIQEPLLSFIDRLRVEGWEILKTQAKLAFKGEIDFEAWIKTLNNEETNCMHFIFEKLLELLRDTGIDRNGENLSILWPHSSDPYSCVKLCCDKRRLWFKMLKDSEWSATFAVATSLCLESLDYIC